MSCSKMMFHNVYGIYGNWVYEFLHYVSYTNTTPNKEETEEELHEIHEDLDESANVDMVSTLCFISCMVYMEIGCTNLFFTKSNCIVFLFLVYI